MRKRGLMDAEMRTVFAQLEEAGIWYVPLKGSVLKEYYPEYGMRQMADCDVLFDKSRAEDVKKRLIPDEGKKYGRHFSTEDFYVYVTAHAYKHYCHFCPFGA